MAARFSVAGGQLTARALSTRTGALQAGQLHEGSPQPRAGRGAGELCGHRTAARLHKAGFSEVQCPFGAAPVRFPYLVLSKA